MTRTVKTWAPTVLSILGGAGVVATAILTAKATPKFEKELAKYDFKDVDKKEELMIKAKEGVKAYALAIGVGSISIACIIGSNVISTKHQASLIGAYATIDQSFKKYKGKLIEMYGKETHESIVDAIAAEKAEEVDVTASYICSPANLLPGDRGEKALFYDEFSDRFFEAPLCQVLNAEYHLNRNYILMGCENINDFYSMLGIPGVKGGEDIGWEQLDEGMYWIEFNHREKKLKDGTPYTVIELLFEPFCYGRDEIPSWNQYRDYRAFLADEYECRQNNNDFNEKEVM